MMMMMKNMRENFFMARHLRTRRESGDIYCKNFHRDGENLAILIY
jgi:hypothetical protein